MNDKRDNQGGRFGAREDLAASDSEIERALDELEELVPPRRSASQGNLIDGRYRVVDELGRGGFGRVFEVRHIHLARTFALKLLHPQIARDPDFITRFQEEARATSVIGHDNIVFVTDFGECADHGHYLVMEYLDGERLNDIVRKRGGLPLADILDCAVAVSSALAATHALGIVHCDLKPANIMSTRRTGGARVWKVLDFGTASIVTESVDSGARFGTPRYMSPEQADGREIDQRCDIFSLGVVLYELLCGTLPWSEKSWSSARSLNRASNPPMPLHLAAKNVDQETSDVVMRALAINPDDRWQDMESFITAFRASVDVTYIPVGDSLDSISESGDKRRFKRSKTAPVVSRVRSNKSLVIERPGLSGDAWRMVFHTTDRLRREYRRNLVARGLFVTTQADFPERDSRANVTIVFKPADAEITLQGRVVSHSKDDPAGFGMELDSVSSKRLERFLDEHSVRRTLANGSVLQAQQKIPPRSWTPAEAFVLSITTEPTTVAELRARSTGLPFDVEKAVFALHDAGLLEISEPKGRQMTRFVRQPTSKPQKFKISFDDSEVQQVLELAEQFRARGNYLAAQEVLERAHALSDDREPFERSLRELKSDFKSAPDSSPAVLSRSFQMKHSGIAGEDTRVRLQRILGTDPLDD